jgi:hypothetical protein
MYLVAFALFLDVSDVPTTVVASVFLRFTLALILAFGKLIARVGSRYSSCDVSNLLRRRTA